MVEDRTVHIELWTRLKPGELKAKEELGGPKPRQSWRYEGPGKQCRHGGHKRNQRIRGLDAQMT